MGIITKLITALRGGVHEAGTSVVDSQEQRILAQELRDAVTNIEEAKVGVAGLIAERMAVHRDLQEGVKCVKEHESYAKKALANGDEKLALEIAVRITELTADNKPLRKLLTDYDDNIRNMKSSIKFSDVAVKQLQREVSNVKATESVIKANLLFTNNYDSSNVTLNKVQNTLDNIKLKQQKKKDTAVAMRSLNHDTALADKMHKASLTNTTPTPQEVLSKLK